ncbi:MAG: ABC transporter permease [Phycisphaerales bacterium]|nr:MAG: ABC transporter permease [Phycisphaerales bacterium]
MVDNAFAQLMLFRFRSFMREPAAVFWSYGFPLILAVSLGIAFRTRPPETIVVDVIGSPGAADVLKALNTAGAEPGFAASIHPLPEAMRRLTLARCAVVVGVAGDGGCVYHFDPMRPNSVLARTQVNDCLQRAAGRAEVIETSDQRVSEPGSRYIDFLLPGLLGLGLMGNGLWGVGFVSVDMRIRKLLKRFTATPMKRSHFLGSLIGARMIFTIPEMAVVLLVGWCFLGVPIRGSLVTIAVVTFVGGLCFAGIGLLVACRAKRIETVSGLMNLVMLPMWLMSGIFFSTDNFPDALQPVVQALPLTHINDALRAAILEGATLGSMWLPLVVLSAVAALTFSLAVRWFRWT